MLEIQQKGGWHMSPVLDFILLLIGLLMLGVPVSLVTLISPIRKKCQRDPVATIFILGALLFGIAFLLVTRMFAGIDVTRYGLSTSSTLNPDYYPDYIADLYDNEQRMQEVENEVWTRRLIPPVFRDDCYSSDREVCILASNAQELPSNSQEWSTYFEDIGRASVSAVTSCVLAWFLTQQRRITSH
jgi:hypothetical protein